MSLDFCLNATRKICVLATNYTHNAIEMADAAGIYECLWRAPENGYTHARQIVDRLRSGIADMEENPDKYIELQPHNGWGSYVTFLAWVKEILAACERNPDAEIETSR